MHRAQIGAPFSANRMYAPSKSGGLCKTREYREWIEHNRVLIAEQLPSLSLFPVEIELTILGGVSWKRSRKKDVDNVIKPIVDLLVTSGVLPDDSHRYVSNVHVKFMPFFNGDTVTMINVCESDNDVSDWAPPGHKIADSGEIVPVIIGEIVLVQESAGETQ